MKSKFIIQHLLALLMLFSAAGLKAQQKTITGTITEAETAAPLAGVTVNVKGTNISTTTNDKGTFTISTALKDAILTISYIGFASQEVSVGSQTTMSITMSKSGTTLNDVIVVGYGTVKKKDLTGAVSSIKAEELIKVPANSIVEAMQAKVPGADITRANGYAGQGGSVRLRGTRSISNTSQSNSVLYIVDGVQGVNASDIDLNDIQSIDILKDASSLAIYGSRGANGVILITTKRGSGGKPKLNFNAYSGISKVAGYGKFMDGDQYVAFRKEAYRAAGVTDYNQIFPSAGMRDAIAKKQYVSWPDLLLHNGLQQNYQMSVSGGTDKTKLYFSGSYYDEKGIMKQDRFKKYSARFNLDQTINEWIKAGVSSQFAYIDNDVRRDPFATASKVPPLGTPFDSLGNFNYLMFGDANFINPLSDEQQPGGFWKNQKTTNFSGAGYLELTPMKGLTIRSSLSTTFSTITNGQFYGKNTIDGKGAASLSLVNNTNIVNFVWENVATYDKKIGDHAFTLTGITTYLSNTQFTNSPRGSNQTFPSQLYYNLAAATASVQVGSSYIKYNLNSLAGRLNYNYKGKYLFTFTGRRDGSSKLGIGNKTDFFPSAAVAWRAIDESFMKNINFLSELKLRVSYGSAGNDQSISPYGTQSTVNTTSISFNEATPANAYVINPLVGNDDVRWERTVTKNVGIDFGIFKNRVTGSVDYYQEETKNLIFQYPLPLSTGVGMINRNIGNTGNKGIEIGITSNNITNKNFSWSTNLTFTSNKEQIISLPAGNVFQSDYRNSFIIGQSPTIYYDYVKLGIWQTNEAAEAAKYNAQPGDIKLKDISGPNGKPDGVLSEAYDRAVIGQRVPKWYGGLNNSFRYKGFDANVLLFARIGQWISSDYYAKFTRDGNNNSAVVDYWTPENPTNAYPRPNVNRNPFFSNSITTLTTREASFVKVRNVTIGYTLPKSLTSKMKIDNFRIYVTGRNLHSFSSIKDFDPEGEGVIDRPLSRLYTFGLNANF